MATASTSVKGVPQASASETEIYELKHSDTIIGDVESLYHAEVNLTKLMIIALTSGGRVMAYNKLESFIMEKGPSLLHMLRKKDSSWTLNDVLKTRRQIFYDLEFNGCRYISLTRYYTFYNARFAKKLAEIKDDAKESLIACKDHDDVLKKYSRDPKRFKEYEFTKCALALVEILHSVVRAFKTKDKLLFSHIQEKYTNFSHLAKSALDFVHRGTSEENFQLFLQLFRTIFTMERTLVKLDTSAIDGLMTATETDLVWSFAGSCVCNGLTSISDLIEKVNELISKAKLRYVTKMTKEHMMQMLEIRRDLYFLPGDGTVWVMEPCTDLSDEVLKTMEHYLLDYLSRNSLRYSDCHRVLVKGVPTLREVLKNRTFITVASYLYTLPDVFFFVKGKVTRTASLAQYPVYFRMPPFDVPVTLDVYSFWLTGLKANAFGVVKEVGNRSMVISLDREYVSVCLGAGLNSNCDIPNVDAFCAREVTKVKGKKITNFLTLMSRGDFVVFRYKSVASGKVLYPFRLLVLEIISYQKPSRNPTEKLKAELARDALESYTEEFSS